MESYEFEHSQVSRLGGRGQFVPSVIRGLEKHLASEGRDQLWIIGGNGDFKEVPARLGYVPYEDKDDDLTKNVGIVYAKSLKGEPQFSASVEGRLE